MPKRPQAGHLGSAEVLLIAATLVAFTFVLTRQYTLSQAHRRLEYFTRWPEMEVKPLLDRYGPRHFSTGVEEWIIRDYFQDRRDGFFVDVGANHFRDHSNSYFLESRLDWSGIAVDALEEFGADYVKYRPRTKYFALFVSDIAGTTTTIFVPASYKLVASASLEFTVNQGHAGAPRQVHTTTLNLLLEQQGIQRIDLLSMDIELSEPKALAGFNLARYRPLLVCIESHAQVRQRILDYFETRGYRLIGKYLRMDPNNLYFRPYEDDVR